MRTTMVPQASNQENRAPPGHGAVETPTNFASEAHNFAQPP